MSKPYGPFRRWLDKIGILSSRSSEEQIPTAELPKPDLEPEPEPEQLTEQELEISTADTKPLPTEIHVAQFTSESRTDELEMEPNVIQPADAGSEINQRGSGPLLDLGDFEPAHAAAEEDFVLDIDLDEAPEPSPIAGSLQSNASPRPGRTESDDGQGSDEEPGMVEVAESKVDSVRTSVAEALKPTVDPMADTQRMMRDIIEPAPVVATERAFTEPEILEGGAMRPGSPTTRPGEAALDQLSPETIDAIARRAVEMLSERAVQEIAWEVVPQLAELLIKRQLEEKNS